MKQVNVGFLGCGNIGCGVFRLMQARREAFEQNEGLRFDVRAVLVRDPNRLRNADVPAELLTTDPARVLDDPGIDVVLEFMGGQEPAATYIIRALRAGKAVVTANKMALAERWSDILAAARKSGAGLFFEASVCGAIPIIRTLTDAMQANSIRQVMGIINGTTNYMLSRMSAEGMDYARVLSEAQRLGLAEPDPTADVEGIDAVYKLSILASLAFHRHVAPERMYREGITEVTPLDIECGKEFGLVLKLLAVAKEEDGRIQCRVHPAFVPSTHPLASVGGAFNAVFITGDAAGDAMLYGKGAGDLPTASAVLSDLVLAGRGVRRLPAVEPEEASLADDWVCEHFIRLLAKDKPGVLSMVAGRMAEQGVSIASMVQKGEADAAGMVQLIFLTHRASEAAVRCALSGIDAGDVGAVRVIRVER